ncbi:hypothetical protein P389DRAFT_166551 [Cystobasidium minutum MCA 4210]|uniref:uncharacterized protein n=1 Tax=Cystobasidium minutum MCA 4210 TaxID=1397322 RepID=UPI0034CD7852|eukprot:jgi/Rhomi1/166551/fgenesh1_kg.2_\
MLLDTNTSLLLTAIRLCNSQGVYLPVSCFNTVLRYRMERTISVTLRTTAASDILAAACHYPCISETALHLISHPEAFANIHTDPRKNYSARGNDRPA